MNRLNELREHLSIRTYFLDAYYRLVRECKPAEYQLHTDDGIKTYIRVVSFHKKQRTVYITNFLEDFEDYLKRSRLESLVQKLTDRYDTIKNIYLPKYKLAGYLLVYDIWELESQNRRDLFIKALGNISKNRPDCLIRFFDRKNVGEELKKLYYKIRAYKGKQEYNKYIIALSINRISDAV